MFDSKKRAKAIASKLPSIAIAVERGGGEVEASDEDESAGLEAAMEELHAAQKAGDPAAMAAAFRAAMACCGDGVESEE